MNEIYNKDFFNKKNNSNNSIINNYYSFYFYPDNFNYDYKKQNMPYIIVNKNNKKIALFEITSEYPHKPPIVFIYTNDDDRGYTTYLNWSLKKGQIMRNFLFTNQIDKSTLFLLWFFIINKNFYILEGIKLKNIQDFTLEPFNSNYCFCCSTIVCLKKWVPSINIIDIIQEILLRNDLFNLCNQNGIRYISSIFNNNKWCLPEDIIYHILSFIIHLD